VVQQNRLVDAVLGARCAPYDYKLGTYYCKLPYCVASILTDCFAKKVKKFHHEEYKAFFFV